MNTVVCDEFSAAGDPYSNGHFYFVNAEYDFKTKIWKSIGFVKLFIIIFFFNFLNKVFFEQPNGHNKLKNSPDESGLIREIPKIEYLTDDGNVFFLNF